MWKTQHGRKLEPLTPAPDTCQKQLHIFVQTQ